MPPDIASQRDKRVQCRLREHGLAFDQMCTMHDGEIENPVADRYARAWQRVDLIGENAERQVLDREVAGGGISRFDPAFQLWITRRFERWMISFVVRTG